MEEFWATDVLRVFLWLLGAIWASRILVALLDASTRSRGDALARLGARVLAAWVIGRWMGVV